MNISEIKVKLCGNDIISIINDFVKVDVLKIKDVEITEYINLKGEFKKIITVPFQVETELLGMQDNKLLLKLKKIKLMKLGIFKFIKAIALKLALKNLKDSGIASKSDCIEVDINKILEKLPFLKFNLNSISCENGFLDVRVEEIDFDFGRIGEKVEKVEEKEEDKEEIDIKNIKVHKVSDYYTEGRCYTKAMLPKKAQKYSDYIFIIPDILALIFRLLGDNRVDTKTKAAIIGSFTYITFPLDILPDKIPFIGRIDDMGVIFFVLNRIVNDVPIEVILENWQGKNEFVIVLKQAIEYLTKFTVAGNVDKVYAVIEDLVTE